MGASMPLPWLLVASVVLCSFALGLAVYVTLVDEQSPLRRAWTAYVAYLDAEMRFLMIAPRGLHIARVQVGIVLLLFALSLVVGDPLLLALMGLVGLGPRLVLDGQHRAKVADVEKQLDMFLQTLANALRASPSLGEALGSTGRLMRPPMSTEIDLTLKEVSLGMPIEDALRSLTQRIGSPTAASAFTALLVGRSTGGDLPEILEKSAVTLREMARLEGVVRTKTAEGKSQAMVLAVIPFVLLAVIYSFDASWLHPLVDSFLGNIVAGVAFVLWLSAIVLARKILEVDV